MGTKTKDVVIGANVTPEFKKQVDEYLKKQNRGSGMGRRLFIRDLVIRSLTEYMENHK